MNVKEICEKFGIGYIASPSWSEGWTMSSACYGEKVGVPNPESDWMDVGSLAEGLESMWYWDIPEDARRELREQFMVILMRKLDDPRRK